MRITIFGNVVVNLMNELIVKQNEIKNEMATYSTLASQAAGKNEKLIYGEFAVQAQIEKRLKDLVNYINSRPAQILSDLPYVETQLKLFSNDGEGNKNNGS